MKIMNFYIPPGYIVVAIIAVVLLTGSLILSSEENDKKDKTPPTINVLTKDFDVYQGDTAKIEINYSDNVHVTKATLYYRKETDSNWKSASILSKSFKMPISEDETKNYHYYVTVNDSAGNGPIGNPSTDGSAFYIITVLKKSTSDENVTIERAVFIEEATATWCSNCPDAAAELHQAYEEQTYPLYYVSMVEDENSKASNRLENDYNIFGYPTIYLDGGYKVLVGSQNIIDNLDNTLKQAANRQAPKIKLTLNSEWNDTNKELENTVFIKNYEKIEYTGTLKVYITEIKSQWTDYDADPYHFSFIDYGLNKEVTISAGDNKSYSQTWVVSDSGFDVVKENLWVIAVLFDNEKHTASSNPSDQEDPYPFDAYYVDATAASRVTEGTLPPTIGLVTPKPYNHYILGKETKNTLVSTTYILGKITIQTNVESDLTIDKVSIQISGGRTSISTNITQPPYEYVWDQFSFGRKTITATVYDEEGRKDTDSIDVWAFIL